jgi:hypothetical protein
MPIRSRNWVSVSGHFHAPCRFILCTVWKEAGLAWMQWLKQESVPVSEIEPHVSSSSDVLVIHSDQK